MFKILFATILGATIFFAWNSISWMVLPWHQQTVKQLENEEVVVRAITNNIGQDGIYLIPKQKYNASLESILPNSEIRSLSNNKEHLAFISFQSAEKMTSMQDSMKYAYVNNIIVSLLIVTLLACTSELSYLARVFFIVMVGMTGALIGHVPNWIWWGFDSSYTIIMIADIIIGWFLAGLIMASLVGRQPKY